MRHKRLKSAIAATLVAATMASPVYASSFQIDIGGTMIGSSNLKFNSERRVMIPITDVSRNLGYTASYDKVTNTVKLQHPTGRKILLTMNKRYALVDDKPIQLQANTFQRDGKSYMSFTGIKPIFQTSITWNTESKTIFVSPSETPVTQPIPQTPSGNYSKFGATNYTQQALATVSELASKAKTIDNSEVVFAKGDKIVNSIKDIGVFLLTEDDIANYKDVDTIVVFDHTLKIAYTL